MIDSANDIAPQLHRAVYAAAGRSDVRQSVLNIYSALQKEIDIRRPLCTASGRCCHFEEFGHRLYVTTMELATFIYELEMNSPDTRRPWNGVGCPFQSAGLCSVHSIRPFGCRIFFCDSTSTDWQREQYEQFHAELKQLHTDLSVPYFYVEWRFVLQALDLLHTGSD